MIKIKELKSKKKSNKKKAAETQRQRQQWIAAGAVVVVGAPTAPGVRACKSLCRTSPVGPSWTRWEARRSSSTRRSTSGPGLSSKSAHRNSLSARPTRWSTSTSQHAQSRRRRLADGTLRLGASGRLALTSAPWSDGKMLACTALSRSLLSVSKTMVNDSCCPEGWLWWWKKKKE